LGIRVVLFEFHNVGSVPLIIITFKKSLRASFADGSVVCFFSMLSGRGATSFLRRAILVFISRGVMALSSEVLGEESAGGEG
jgi:hypothetical protein